MNIIDTFCETEKPQYRIFQDMDGCLTAFEQDFKTHVRTDLTPREFEAKYGKSIFWSTVEKLGESFWSEMNWMLDGHQLWNYIKKYDPTILSAPSRDQNCITGKTKWVHKNLGIMEQPILKIKGWNGSGHFILNSDKYRYCRFPTDILIDDTEKKILPWREKGGIGILHKNAEQTIKELQQLGL